MFKFHKVRGPEEVGDAISTLEETANRLESVVEVAQKEKSRLHLLVGNVTDRVDQIKQSAAGFEEIVRKIENFQSQFKNIEGEIQSAQQQAEGLKELRAETTKLFNQFKQLKSELDKTSEKLAGCDAAANQLGPLDDKINNIKSSMLPEIEAISLNQTQLIDSYNDFLDRLDKAELKLQGLAKLGDEFKRTSDNIVQESARITTWMEATDSISVKLDQATEVFETTKQKIDGLHELAEYVENKTKALKKQKELLKQAHVESGRANGLFWEIKSKLSELEQDTEKVRRMEMQAGEFDRTLKNLESRFDQINSFSKKIDQIIGEYSKLDEYAKQLQEHRKQLNVIDDLVKQIDQHVETARNERNQLTQAEQQINLFIKRSEESQNESRAIIRQMTELMQNTEKFLQRAPDVGKALTQIEAIRKRALVLENKLMEVMASSAEIKNQSEQATELKKSVEKFSQDVDQKMTVQKRELADLYKAVSGLKYNLDQVQTNWNKIPQLMEKLSEIDKIQGNLDKTYKSVMQREQNVMGLKNLMEQNGEAFKGFEKLSTEIHQKATEIISVKSELDNIDYRVKALSAAAQQLNLLSERIEKTESEVENLDDNFQTLNQQVGDWKTQSESMKTEWANINKTHENLRTNIGQVMDLFTHLSQLRGHAEEETKRLNGYFQQAEQKIKELNDIHGRSIVESGKHIEKLDEISQSIKMLVSNQDELVERYNNIEAESAKITSLANAIGEKHMQMASLDEKISMLGSKLAESDKIQAKLGKFEKAFDKMNSDITEIGDTINKMENVNKDFNNYRTQIAGFEQKITVLTEKTKAIDKLKKDLDRASILTEELKARQNSLKEERELINKAINAASKLEELVYRAEHITKEKK